MSGGSYNYAFYKIEELADKILHKGERTSLRKAFCAHLVKVAAVAKAIEWNDSGDGDDREDELIRAVISPTAEIEEATKSAKEASAELTRLLGGME